MAVSKELEKKLTQMFIVGLPGTELDSESQDFLQKFQPGGVIFFAYNYENVALLSEMCGEIQRVKDSLPFFVAVDHEGGRVQRFKKPFTHFPEPVAIGEIGSPKLAFLVAEVMGRELSAVGVNLNFHPLCDIHTRLSNPVIGKRSFGGSEELVSRMASAMVRGFLASGMISCVKHFPGHGDTTVDSHFDLPIVKRSWEELKSREIKPFVKAVRSRVDMIMTAHILNPLIDEQYPATLSKKTVTELLRKELRYQRLVITDDMQMQAIEKGYGAEDAVRLAIEAGCDVLLYRDRERGRKAMEMALALLAKGKISEARVEESYVRIIEAKAKINPRTLPIDEAAKIIGCDAHHEILQMVLEKRKPSGKELDGAY